MPKKKKQKTKNNDNDEEVFVVTFDEMKLMCFM